jgi:hypothetical protein
VVFGTFSVVEQAVYVFTCLAVWPVFSDRCNKREKKVAVKVGCFRIVAYRWVWLRAVLRKTACEDNNGYIL